jgi:hypothetical protein
VIASPAPTCRHTGVALGHAPLHVDRAAYRLDDTWELEHQTFADRLDDATTVLADLGVDQFAPMCLQRRKSIALFFAHEAGIPRDIG